MDQPIVNRREVEEMKTCDRCNGMGEVRDIGFPEICPKCKGEKKVKDVRYSLHEDFETRECLAI